MGRGLNILTLLVAMLISPFWNFESQAAQVLFTPELTLSESYSDNIFLTNQDEESDYITAAGVILTLDILGRTAGLQLSYNPTYNAHANYSELDYWRHSGRMVAWNDFGPNTRLQVTDDYLETEDPLDQTNAFQIEDVVQGPTITADNNRRGRLKYRTNLAEARLTHNFTARDNVYAAVQHQLREEVDPPPSATVDDYTSWQPMLGFEYWFVQHWGVSFDGYYSNRDYVDQNDRQEYRGTMRLSYAVTNQLNGFVQYRHTYLDYDQEIDNDYTIYEPSAGITYNFKQTAHITIGCSYYYQDFDNTDRNQEGTFLDSEIYKRWAFRSSYIDLTGSSGLRIDDTGTEDRGLNIYYQARLDLGHDFTRRFSGNLYGSYMYNEYPDMDPELQTSTITSGAGIRYQALQWLFFSLNYSYRTFQSDIELDEYTENRVTLTISLRPSRPFRLN